MSRRADVRALAGAIQARDRPAPAADVPAPRAAEVRTKPVRHTVDVAPDTSDAFAAWRLETALALGRARVTTQDVLETVIAALLDDDTVARRVRARLEDAG